MTTEQKIIRAKVGLFVTGYRELPDQSHTSRSRYPGSNDLDHAWIPTNISERYVKSFDISGSFADHPFEIILSGVHHRRKLPDSFSLPQNLIDMFGRAFAALAREFCANPLAENTRVHLPV